MELEPSNKETQELAIVPVQTLSLAEAEGALQHEGASSLSSKEQLVAHAKFRLSNAFGGRLEDLWLKRQIPTH